MAAGKIQPDAKGNWTVRANTSDKKPPKKTTHSLTLVTPTQQGVEQARDNKKRKHSDSQGSAQKRRKLEPSNQKKKKPVSVGIKGVAKKKKAQTSQSRQGVETKPQKKKTAAVKKPTQQKKKSSVKPKPKSSKLANYTHIYNGRS